jgi:hypothetical protein
VLEVVGSVFGSVCEILDVVRVLVELRPVKLSSKGVIRVKVVITTVE